MADNETKAPETKASGASDSSSTPSARPAGDRPSGDRPRREGGPGGRPPYGSRPQGGPGGGPGGPRGDRKFFRRKKVCKFCVEKIDDINYKDVRMLGQFVAERGKIVPRRLSGVCTPHQRRVSAAIKQARNIALLPFAQRG